MGHGLIFFVLVTWATVHGGVSLSARLGIKDFVKRVVGSKLR